MNVKSSERYLPAERLAKQRKEVALTLNIDHGNPSVLDGK